MSQPEWLWGLGRNKLDILCVCSVHAQGWFVKFFLKINHYLLLQNSGARLNLKTEFTSLRPAQNCIVKCKQIAQHVLQSQA